MKKLIAILLILLIVIFIGAPYFTGKVAETETMKMVDTIKLDSENYGDIEVLTYDRGLRSTSAKYRYTPPASLAAMLTSDKPIDYGCESKHGVLGIDYICHLQGDGAYADFVNEKLDGKDPLSMYGSVSVFGAITQTYEIKAIQNLDLDGQTINTPKAQLNIETDNEMTAFKFTGDTEAFQLDDEEGTLDIGGINIEGDLESIATMLFTGSLNVDLDTLSFKDSEEEFTLDKVSFSSITRENGDNIDSRGTFKLGSMIAPNGDIKSIENVELVFEVNGVDTKAYSEYQAFSMDIQKQAFATLEAGQEPQIDPNAMIAALPIIEKMLKPGLELNLGVEAELNGTANEVELELSLLEALTLAEMSIFITDTEQALKKLDIELETKLSNSFVESQAMLAVMLGQSPLIEKTDDNYKLKFSSNKTIELNGKSITFAELQSMVFGSLGS